MIYLSKSATTTESYNEIITNFITSTPTTTFLEQLLWLKAQAIEGQLAQDGFNADNHERLLDTYLRIIEEFPAGFYAPYVRLKLNDLSKVNS